MPGHYGEKKDMKKKKMGNKKVKAKPSGKVFTAKNGRKYKKLQNGQVRFI
jgi:hypothetical protein